LCGLFFFARTKKKELFFQKERKKNKQKTKKRRILDPVFDWGLALNPIAFIALSRKVYYILTNSPPLGYDTREMAAPKKKKGEDVKRERERES
jgi:hypothetical protein